MLFPWVGTKRNKLVCTSCNDHRWMFLCRCSCVFARFGWIEKGNVPQQVSKMLVGNAMVGIYMYLRMPPNPEIPIKVASREGENDRHKITSTIKIFWHYCDLGQHTRRTKNIYLNIHYAKLWYAMVNYRRLNNEKFESQIFTHNFGPTPNSTPIACFVWGYCRRLVIFMQFCTPTRQKNKLGERKKTNLGETWMSLSDHYLLHTKFPNICSWPLRHGNSHWM